MSHHHPDHDKEIGGGARSYGVVTVVAVLILLVAVAVAAIRLTGGLNATQEEDAERSAVRLKNLAESKEADAAQLSTYGWADRAKGIVRIPVNHAMDLVIPELNARAPKTGAATQQP